MAVTLITCLVLLALAGWFLVKSHNKPLSKARSLGYGALCTPFLLTYGFGRYIQVAAWQIPIYALVAAVLASVMIDLLRLPRRLAPEPKPDLLDLAVDKLIDQFVKR